MGKYACSVRPWDLGPFHSLKPCNCNEDPLKDCTYVVNTKTSTSYVYGKGPIVEHISIECNCCGKKTWNDVEYMGVYENDLKF